MRNVTVAATQMACIWDEKANIERAEGLVRQAKEKGADLVLIQELFAAPYFCQDQIHEFFALAHPFEGNPLIAHFARLAAELGVVLPLSYFERAGQSYFNSLAVIDADGRCSATEDLRRRGTNPQSLREWLQPACLARLCSWRRYGYR